MGISEHLGLRLWGTAGLALGICLSGAAMAADLTPMTKKAAVPPAPILNSWTFSFTPYGWVTLMNGSTTVKGRTVDVDVGFNNLMDLIRQSEIPKDLMAFMGYFEARNGRLSLFADVVYEKIGLNEGMVRSRGVDALNASVGVSAGLKYEMVIAEMAAAYEVVHWESTGVPGSGTAIDVFGGARGWWQTADASLSASGTINIGDLMRTPTEPTRRSAAPTGSIRSWACGCATNLRQAGTSLPAAMSAASASAASSPGRLSLCSTTISTSTTALPGAAWRATGPYMSITRKATG